MSLLAKIQDRLHKPEVKPSGSAEQSIKQLNGLPDSEKLKVLDYLKSLKDLHSNEPA